MPSTAMGEAARLVCGTCECDLDRCAFCDHEDCSNPVCYGCMIVAIGQQIAEPHKHGG